MQYSYSRVSIYNRCPYRFKLRYLDNIKVWQDFKFDDPLIVGNSIHMGLEKNIDVMNNFYLSNYPIITDRHINQMIKLEILHSRVIELLKGVTIAYKEYEIDTPNFKGIVDLIVKNDDGTFDIFDYKHTNNIVKYIDSSQLHLYKYYLEQLGMKINKMGFIFIPKTFIRQKKTETLFQFRKRMINIVEQQPINLIGIEYNPLKVKEFIKDCDAIKDATNYPKITGKKDENCKLCEYEILCKKGIDIMVLPKNERREKKVDINPDMWLYADSYVGKSTLIDQFDDLLFLNTDGNTDNTTSPVIRIKDDIKFEGRVKKVKFAWEIFTDTLDELEKDAQGFKRVCIDLVEDLFDHCRIYMYNKLGIEHEQDAGFGKGYDMVTFEFIKQIKRLKNIGIQVIYISKELSNEVTLKNGTKLTTIRPNIKEKYVNVLSGTVDLTLRAYQDINNNKRYLQLEKVPNTFGGGRFNFKVPNCELNKDAFISVLKDAQQGVATYSKMDEQPQEEKPKRTIRNVRV